MSSQVVETLKCEEKGCLALVVGMGASGLASVEYLLERGWAVRVVDTRENPPNLEKFNAMQRVEVHLGSLSEATLEGVTLLVMSPGISPLFGAAAPLVKAAREKGIEVVGEIELFARELERIKVGNHYEPIVIGITGTNGKTTTTMLTSKMVAKCGKSVITAGNVGPNAVHELLVAEHENRLPDVWVLELSSFQLETTSSLHCKVAAFLNVTEDHLDWHGSIEAYAQAKARIFQPETIRVVNREDDTTVRLSEGGEVYSFGASVPQKEGDAGLVDNNGHIALVWRKEGKLEPLCAEEDLHILGRHNTMNALAALLLVRSAGLPVAPAIEALRHYQGEPHRVEEVLTTEDGVTFVDDSKGTNVGAVLAAVKGFAAQKRRVMILMGGDGKGQDFSPLAPALKEATGAVALIGRDAPKIAEVLEETGVPLARFTSLEEAVEWLWNRRQKDDVILLSPACASWDMFKDYVERSARFIARAHQLTDGSKTC